MALGGKKLLFAQYYAMHENGARAARDAGYSKNTSNKRAYDLLQEPDVKAMVDRLRAERLQRLEITGDRILEEIAKIAFSDITEIMDERGMLTAGEFEALTPEQRACIASVKQTAEGVEIKLYDKLAALTKLGQHKKLFTDVHESKHTFNKMGDVTVQDEAGNTVPLEFDIGQEPDSDDTQH